MCVYIYSKFTLDSCAELTTLALIFGDLLLAVTLYCELFSTFDAGFVGFKSSSIFPDAYKDTQPKINHNNTSFKIIILIYEIFTGKRFFNNGESPNGAETRAKICWCTGTEPFVLAWFDATLEIHTHTHIHIYKTLIQLLFNI